MTSLGSFDRKRNNVDRRRSEPTSCIDSNSDEQSFTLDGVFEEYNTKDWGTIVEEEEERLQQEMCKMQAALCGHSKSELLERNVEVQARRQKQIDYGRNTPEYLNYRKVVTKRSLFHPRTPDKTVKYSRRGWDTVVRIWRKKLHVWDPNKKSDEEKETASIAKKARVSCGSNDTPASSDVQSSECISVPLDCSSSSLQQHCMINDENKRDLCNSLLSVSVD